MIYLLVRSDDRPDLLPAVAGCYAASGQPQISIGPDGTLKFDKAEVRVMPINAKSGVLLQPERGLYIDRFHNNRLMLDNRVLLLGMSADYQMLSVPDYRSGQAVDFTRTSC